jgi:hypothetical protein
MPRTLVRLLVVALFVFTAPGAVADSFSLRIGVAPPAPRVEVITAAPSPAHFWVAGHWRWSGNTHVWVGGRWLKGRPGQVWVRDHWAHRGNEWFYYPGRWVAAGPAPGEVRVVAPGPPPALRVESVPPPPGPEAFWVNGHWGWENHAHVWMPGRWETRRVEEVWVPAHWLHERGGWTYVGGHWRHI